MNKKVLSALTEKCKDFGLSDKAIAELAELASEGIGDDSTDEEIAARAETYVPLAKAMQGEVTRKVTAAKRSAQQQQSKQKPADGGEGGDGGEGAGEGGDDIPAWFKSYKEAADKESAQLKAELEGYKAAEKTKARKDEISAKAKELGIPEIFMKRFSIADDADIAQELADFKQDLINDKLLSEGSGGGFKSSTAQQTKEEALAWAKGLADNSNV